MIRYWLAIALILLLPVSHASEEHPADRHLSLNSEHQVQAEMIEIAMNQGLFDHAIELSEALIARVTRPGDAIETHDNYSPGIIGRLMVNHGIMQYTAGHYDAAMTSIDEGLLLIESQHKGFSEKLVHGLTARGAVEMSLRRYEDADESFRRAQHIIHREQGVTSERQLNLVRLLASSSNHQRKYLEADQLNMFSLHVAERSWGANSMELVPVLVQLGGYFSNRSYNTPYDPGVDPLTQKELLFRRALGMFNRSIDIIEQTYGPNDIRLLEPLRALGKARMQNAGGRNLAIKPYTRALQIVEENAASDATDRALALVDMGDLHTVLRDSGAAREYYLQAWQLMQETEELRTIAQKTFVAPIQLHPTQKTIIRLGRTPDAAKPGTKLFARLNYDVSADGRVRNIKVIDRNVPNSRVRDLRLILRSTYFRPRIVDGELVATEGLVLHQRFIAPKNQETEDVQEADDGSSEEKVPDQQGELIAKGVNQLEPTPAPSAETELNDSHSEVKPGSVDNPAVNNVAPSSLSTD